MKYKKELIIVILSAPVLFFLITFDGGKLSNSENSKLSQAVFHVS